MYFKFIISLYSNSHACFFLKKQLEYVHYALPQLFLILSILVIYNYFYYSFLIADNALNFIALLAGKYPEITPITTENTSANP